MQAGDGLLANPQIFQAHLEAQNTVAEQLRFAVDGASLTLNSPKEGTAIAASKKLGTVNLILPPHIEKLDQGTTSTVKLNCLGNGCPVPPSTTAQADSIKNSALRSFDTSGWGSFQAGIATFVITYPAENKNNIDTKAFHFTVK